MSCLLGHILRIGDAGAVRVGDGVALVLLGPAIGDGVDEGRVGGVKQSQRKVIDPSLYVYIRCVLKRVCCGGVVLCQVVPQW